LLDPKFTHEAVSGVASAVHLAAAFDLGLPAQYLVSTNVNSTRNMVSAAAGAGLEMFVQYSTCDVFGLKRESPIGEDDSKKPQCAYSMSKLLSELTALQIARRQGLALAVVRPTFVYGPGAIYTARSFLLLPSLLAHYARSLPLPAGGPQINAIHVEDLASATVAVLQAGTEAAGLAYDVADDSDMSAHDFLRLIFEPFGISCSGEIKIPWKAIELTGKTGEAIPHAFFRLIDRFLQKRWDRLVAQNGLKPLLSVKLDRDLLGFLYGEHLYSNERTKSLGWRPKYPTFADGWPSTVDWYRENALIP
jgi:nucleoside-diphosphate-sugar epimerase